METGERGIRDVGATERELLQQFQVLDIVHASNVHPFRVGNEKLGEIQLAQMKKSTRSEQRTVVHNQFRQSRYV